MARSARRSWILLSVAIALEVAGTSLLPATDTFTKPLPTITVLTLYGFSYFLLSRCLKDLPLGVAYAVWAGVGTALVAAIGVVFLHESVSAYKVVGILLIVAGVVAINLKSDQTKRKHMIKRDSN